MTEEPVQHELDSKDVPQLLRQARQRSGMSLRQLAKRLDISASALSQIETGKLRPSVRTLYDVVSELDMSLDELFDNRHPDGSNRPVPTIDGPARAAATDAEEPVRAASRATPQAIRRSSDRPTLQLDSGVLWERLTAEDDAAVDFLRVRYEPGGASNSNGTLVRHAGREYGTVLSGRLDVTIGFDTYHLGPGDSISFSSGEPHLLANNVDEPATAIWFVVGRRETRVERGTPDGPGPSLGAPD